MKTTNSINTLIFSFAKTRLFFYHLSVVCLLSTSLFSCTKTSTAEQDQKDDAAITSYLSQHSINATKTASGLYYTIEDPGTGMQVSATNSVYMKYKAYLLDGTVFDENKVGTTLSLPNTILGWQEGIPKFKVGGKGKLFIPSRLGYGSQATGKIPANSVLVFEVEVIEIK